MISLPERRRWLARSLCIQPSSIHVPYSIQQTACTSKKHLTYVAYSSAQPHSNHVHCTHSSPDLCIATSFDSHPSSYFCPSLIHNHPCNHHWQLSQAIISKQVESVCSKYQPAFLLLFHLSFCLGMTISQLSNHTSCFFTTLDIANRARFPNPFPKSGGTLSTTNRTRETFL